MIPDENTKLFIENFKRVKDLGWVKSHRSHNTGIGKTLEDLMGVEENNLDEPDFGNIEIKSHRKLVSSYITLFTKAPTHPKSANTLLRDNYGISNDDNKDIKKLHSSMFSSHFNNTYNRWGFRLRTDDSNQKLIIDVKDLKTNELYYTEEFEEFLNTKQLDINLSNYNGLRDFISIDEITSLIGMLYIQKSKGVFNIASGKPVSLKNIVLKIHKITKSKKIIINNIINNDNNIIANITKIKKKINWKPNSDINKILKKFYLQKYLR